MSNKSVIVSAIKAVQLNLRPGNELIFRHKQESFTDVCVVLKKVFFLQTGHQNQWKHNAWDYFEHRADGKYTGRSIFGLECQDKKTERPMKFMLYNDGSWVYEDTKPISEIRQKLLERYCNFESKQVTKKNPIIKQLKQGLQLITETEKKTYATQSNETDQLQEKCKKQMQVDEETLFYLYCFEFNRYTLVNTIL